MTNEVPTLEAQKEEAPVLEGAERTRERRAYVPRSDIYETEDAIFVLADMPGVDEDSVEITLAKNVLTITAYAESSDLGDYEPVYAEYESGDYTRRFSLSDQIDQAKIEASLRDGVLKLMLPKAEPARARTIKVKAD